MTRYKLYRERKNCTCTHMEQHAEGAWVKWTDIEPTIQRANEAIHLLNETIASLRYELREAKQRRDGGVA